MSSLTNTVYKPQAYEIDGSCAIRVGSEGGPERAPAPVSAAVATPWEADDLGALEPPCDLPVDEVSEEEAEAAHDSARVEEESNALSQEAAEALLAQARQRAEEILAGANERAVALAEEACLKIAERLEGQLRSEITALREQAVREAGEIVAKAQADRQIMLASAQREIIALAIDIARRVVARELRVSPDVVMAVAAEALSHLPSGTDTVRLLVNPADLEAVRAGRETLAKAANGLTSLETQADARVEPGGCVVQSPSGDVDGRLSTRFEQIEDVLLRGNSGPVSAPPTADGGGAWR